MWQCVQRDPATSPKTLRLWASARLGKTQRQFGLGVIDALPRRATGKVLPRELRALWGRG